MASYTLGCCTLIGIILALTVYLLVLAHCDPGMAELFHIAYEGDGSDPWLAYSIAWAEAAAADSPRDSVKVWKEFVERCDCGAVTTEGIAMRLQVSSLYQLACSQAEADDFGAALKSLDRVSGISPHFACTHYNRGLVLWNLAVRAENAGDRVRLLREARKELLEQLQYNYGGTAVNLTLDALGRFPQDEGGHDAGQDSQARESSDGITTGTRHPRVSP